MRGAALLGEVVESEDGIGWREEQGTWWKALARGKRKKRGRKGEERRGTSDAGVFLIRSQANATNNIAAGGEGSTHRMQDGHATLRQEAQRSAPDRDTQSIVILSPALRLVYYN